MDQISEIRQGRLLGGVGEGGGIILPETEGMKVYMSEGSLTALSTRGCRQHSTILPKAWLIFSIRINLLEHLLPHVRIFMTGHRWRGRVADTIIIISF